VTKDANIPHNLHYGAVLFEISVTHQGKIAGLFKKKEKNGVDFQRKEKKRIVGVKFVTSSKRKTVFIFFH
jgi:hypothetical protein